MQFCFLASSFWGLPVSLASCPCLSSSWSKAAARKAKQIWVHCCYATKEDICGPKCDGAPFLSQKTRSWFLSSFFLPPPPPLFLTCFMNCSDVFPGHRASSEHRWSLSFKDDQIRKRSKEERAQSATSRRDCRSEWR